MRRVGESIDERQADRFVRFLSSKGIAAEAREDDGQMHAIWVMDEDQLTVADDMFKQYKMDPGASQFDVKQSSHKALNTSRNQPTQTKSSRNRQIDVRTEIFNRAQSRQMPVTMSLIILSVIATLMSKLPAFGGIAHLLYFSENFVNGLSEISQGQIWRLITPIFLHGGVWHLLFNMMWVYQLGGAMESHEGSRFLAAFTFSIAILVNCAEYLVTGPYFIGMSGVVYAMLGYAWIMSKHEYNSPYDLGPGTAFIMFAWLVLCLIGVIPGVANTQHVVGLFLGGIVGLFRSGYVATRFRQARRK